MNQTLTLLCSTCQKEFRPDEIDYTCPKCGPLFGTLEVTYDYEKIKPKLSRNILSQTHKQNHWRYLPILPVLKPEFIQPLSVGWTPVYDSKKLASEWGIKSLYVKDDGRNPTASFKDRASAVAIVKALEKNATIVTAASTGNAASSWAAFTALAGLQAIIFVPQNAPKAKLAQLLLYGAKVFQVQGTYDDAFDLCCQAAEKWGWYNRSTAINPYLGEGKKTAALEVCEQLSWKVPDYIFVSAGDGCILQGTWKGFKDFHKLGLIDKLPKIVGVQAEGAAPLFKAWQNGKIKCEPLVPATVADSIAVGVPRDQVKALCAVRESEGLFVTVSDAEILSAMSVCARHVGVFAEPAGATALAGVRKLCEMSGIGPNDEVVALITGNGLKDVDGAMKAVNQQPILVENDIDSVAQQIKNEG